MQRKQKQVLTNKLQDIFTSNNTILVTKPSHLNAEQFFLLRSSLYKDKARVMVTNNNLAKLALKNNFLSDYFAGPTAIVYSQDLLVTIKNLNKFTGKNLTIVAGKYKDKLICKETINNLATFNSTEELYTKTIYSLQYAVVGLLSSMAIAPIATLYALGDYLNKNELINTRSTNDMTIDDSVLDNLATQISELSLPNYYKLIEKVREMVGAPPFSAMSASISAPSATTTQQNAPVEQKTKFTIKLKSYGASKIKVLQGVRELRKDLGLADAKKLVEQAPDAVILEEVSREEADKAIKLLKEKGAECEEV